MTLEEAIKMALEYENKVYGTYKEASEKATTDTGKKVFNVMADEEMGHIEYLESRLAKWKETGKLALDDLATVVPARERIDDGVAKLKEQVAPGSRIPDVEGEYLERALKLEQETSAFYKKMVDELEADEKRLFERFVEIEEGHVAIVQAELDCVRGHGTWFDMQEFDLHLG